jgi:hypothetical protein
MKRLTFGVTITSLVGCAILAVIWWTILAVSGPPFEGKLLAFLGIMAAVQVASWAAVLRLSMHARSTPSVGLALFVAGLALVLLCSHLLNGFTPALGTPIAFLVLCASGAGFLVARHLSASYS